MTEEHGGPEGLLYCVDRESYQAFCEAMGWQDPAEFGTPQPTGTGQPPPVARTPSPLTPEDTPSQSGNQTALGSAAPTFR